jgi:hypothetical protein
MKFSIMLAVLVMLATPALAVDFGTVLKDRDGNPYLDCVKADPANPQACKETAPMTLGRLVATALDKSEPGMKWQDRTKVGKLQEKVIASGDVPLDRATRRLRGRLRGPVPRLSAAP